MTNSSLDAKVQQLTEAIEALFASEGELSIRYGRLHKELAETHNAREDFESAAKHFSKAIDIFEAVKVFGGEVDAAEKDLLYRQNSIALLKADEARQLSNPDEPARHLHNCVDHN